MNELQKYYIDDEGDENAVIYVSVPSSTTDENIVPRHALPANSRRDAALEMEPSRSFRREMGKIKGLLRMMRSELAENGDEPDELEIGLDINFSAEFGIVLLSAEAGATVRMKAVWKKHNT